MKCICSCIFSSKGDRLLQSWYFLFVKQGSQIDPSCPRILFLPVGFESWCLGSSFRTSFQKMRSHAVSIFWASRGWKDLIWSQGEDWIDGMIYNSFAKYCPVMKSHFLGKSTETRGGRAFSVLKAIQRFPSLDLERPHKKELAFYWTLFHTFTSCNFLPHAASPFSPQLHVSIWRGKSFLLFITVLHIFWPYVMYHCRGMLALSVCLLSFGSVCTHKYPNTHAGSGEWSLLGESRWSLVVFRSEFCISKEF